MRLYNSSDRCSVYAVQGEDSGAAQIPEWIAKKRKRSLKYDPQFAQSLDLLQSFEFPEASQCVRVSEDGDWVMAVSCSSMTSQRNAEKQLTTLDGNLQESNSSLGN